MAKHRFFWHEIFRIWAQWFGVGLASIPAGITLGLLLRSGVGQKEARAIALSLGFVLALAFWVLIDRMFVVHPIECAIGISSNVIQFEVSAGAAKPSPTIAAAIVFVTLYTFQQPLTLPGGATLTTITCHAIPEL